MDELEEKKQEWWDAARRVRGKLTDVQEKNLKSVWEAGAEAAIPPINRWILETYNSAFEYGVVSEQYITLLNEHYKDK